MKMVPHLETSSSVSQGANCYEITAEYLLTVFQPYPGDEQGPPPCAPYNRFQIKQHINNAEFFRIRDTFQDFEITVMKTQLANPKFNLCHWYAKQHTHVLKLWIPTTSEYPPQLENPVVLVTRSLLQARINSHFPNVKPTTWSDDRFFVYLKDYGSTTYIIVDNDLNLDTEIDLTTFENPGFNLIDWYIHQITMNEKFYNQYLAYHKQVYVAEGRKLSDTTHRAKISLDTEIPFDRDNDELKFLRSVKYVLETCAPYPGDDSPRYPIDPMCTKHGDSRFELDILDVVMQKLLMIYEQVQGLETFLLWNLTSWSEFSVSKWYAERCGVNNEDEFPWDSAHEWMMNRDWQKTTVSEGLKYVPN